MTAATAKSAIIQAWITRLKTARSDTLCRVAWVVSIWFACADKLNDEVFESWSVSFHGERARKCWQVRELKCKCHLFWEFIY